MARRRRRRYHLPVAVVVEQGAFGAELRRLRLRRRLSQLELAWRAGTTQRHLSFVEQGHSRPGRTMVVRLAESLELSLRDRNALLATAGYAPIFPESDLGDDALLPVLEAVGHILDGHLPYPAVVVRPYGELVAANAAFELLTAGAAPELLEPPINVLRLAVHPAGLGGRVENLAEWGRHILDSLRARAPGRPDPRLDALIAELEGYVPAPPPSSDHIGFAVPLRLRADGVVLRLITTLTSFATAVDVTVAELQLEAFLPADAATAAILQARSSSDGLRAAGADQSSRRPTTAPA